MGSVNKYNKCLKFIKEFDADFERAIGIKNINIQGLAFNDYDECVHYFVNIDGRIFFENEELFDPEVGIDVGSLAIILELPETEIATRASKIGIYSMETK